jgi:hypothetical protein
VAGQTCCTSRCLRQGADSVVYLLPLVPASIGSNIAFMPAATFGFHMPSRAKARVTSPGVRPGLQSAKTFF